MVGDLLYEYDKLFANDRAAAWISLSDLSQLRQFEDSDDLKDKVLFSVIVVSLPLTAPSPPLYPFNMILNIYLRKKKMCLLY